MFFFCLHSNINIFLLIVSDVSEIFKLTDDDGERDLELLKDEEQLINDCINKFQGWGLTVDGRVQKNLQKEESLYPSNVSAKNLDNALFFNELRTKLLNREMILFGEWSSVMLDEFGFGSIPATSSGSENNFNNIKNRVLELPMRVDDFAKSYLDYQTGKLLEIDLELNEMTQHHQHVDHDYTSLKEMTKRIELNGNFYIRDV